MKLPFQNRIEAGQYLAQALKFYSNRNDVVVLALPRGGVPVASEVAIGLHATLDLLLVRKLGAPWQEELAMGAIASGGIRILNESIVSSLSVSDQAIEDIAAKEQRELERREQVYRGARTRVKVTGKQVILVDDGIATGATMRAAIAALRQQNPAKIIVAVPVAPAETVSELNTEADEVICLAMPDPFTAIGKFYTDFSQVSDSEVKQLLSEAWANES